MNTFLKFVTDHKKFFIILGAGILGLLILAGVLNWAENAWNQHKLQQDYTNENIAVKQAENLQANLVNLEQQYNAAVNNANISKQQLSNIKQQVNTAKVETNKALENVNATKNENYNGVTQDEANKARCEAFPDSFECQ